MSDGCIGIALLVALISAVAGGMLGAERGRGGAGFVLGLLFGPLGVIMVLLTPPDAETEARRREEVAAKMGDKEAEGRMEARRLKAQEQSWRSVLAENRRADEQWRQAGRDAAAGREAWAREWAWLTGPARRWRKRQVRRRAARREAREERRRVAGLEKSRLDGRCPACQFEVRGLPGERVICPNCLRGVRFPAAL